MTAMERTTRSRRVGLCSDRASALRRGRGSSGNMSAVAAAYRQQGGGKRPASQAANRAKKKPALGLLHRKNPLQGELPERAAPHARDLYTYPFDVLTHPVFDAENMQGPEIREHVAREIHYNSTTDNYKQITRRNTPHKRKASPKHMAA
jgi:cation transport regulator ChaB